VCGIVGYAGKGQASQILIDSLKRLEYRGYDSAGIAVFNGKLKIFKDKGKIGDMEKTMQSLPELSGNIGIGHTRWATHGKPSQINAHPHTSGDVAVVHNGIVENYRQLKEMLIKEGYVFVSETDTEVLAHLINYYKIKNQGLSLVEVMIAALNEVKGSYALGVLCGHDLVVAKKDSPIVIGIGNGENFVASDMPAILKYTNKMIFLDDNELAVIEHDAVKIFDWSRRLVQKNIDVIDLDIESAEKSGYEHFMLKEIHEQPRSLHQTFAGRINELEGSIKFDSLKLTEDDIKNISKVSITACGTSYNAGLIGKYLFENVAGIHVDIDVASEFRYFCKSSRSLVVAISQSGETADTLSAIKEAKNFGCRTLAITNVANSTITRVADNTIYIRAGPEIGVAATKTFISQVGVLYLLTLYFGKIRGKIDTGRAKNLILGLRQLPSKISQILDNKEIVEKCAKKYARYNDTFFIGRAYNYPVALEGALKLKEISYIHAEGYAAGELKHGPLALISKNTPVIAMAVKGSTYEKMINNIKEVKSRDAPVIAIVDEDDREIEKFVDDVIRIPGTEEILSPILLTVVAQLYSYYSAKIRDCPIDQPRNLAKSVTVE
jgi:glucosamine--fructose-6-phosphate aminotransferase (isomerizing)